MKHYVSEGRAVYEDVNHGLFSQKLAEWAISMMKTKENGRLVLIKPVSVEELEKVFNELNINIDSKYLYTAWYLFNMAKADYSKALPTDQMRAYYVVETLYDPDGCPESVLECFTAKMCAAEIPIFWEKYL